ncbi:MAG: hypothetical protein K8I02_00730, partial [Candidatus Methylomirabilis sp.]|nr:hypothetical protein [Deltaproteobacteria bacterium]
MGALSRIFLSFLLIPLTAAGAWAQCALPSVTDAFIDVSATTPIALGDDDAATFYWPVTFDLFSTNYNYVTIGSNGLITLQSAAPFPAPPPPNPAGSTDPNNVGMPNAAAPNAVVAPFWDDLDPSSGGNVYAAGHAAAGQPQRLVVQWD